MGAACSATCRPERPCRAAGCPYAVEIGADNEAGGDLDVQAIDNVIRGNGRVKLGTGNYAKGDATVEVSQNEIGGGRGETRMGSGNRAGRNNKIVITGNRMP